MTGGEAMSDGYVFRGGYIEDPAGDRWWSADLLKKVEAERDEARKAYMDLMAERNQIHAERDEARDERDTLRRERDQLLARLRAVYPWVGVAPFVPAAIMALSLERDLARDSIEEISADIRRRGW